MTSVDEAVAAFDAQVKAERGMDAQTRREQKPKWAEIAEMLCAAGEEYGRADGLYALLITVACARGGLCVSVWFHVVAELMKGYDTPAAFADCLAMLWGYRAELSVKQAAQATDAARANKAAPRAWVVEMAREAMASVSQPEGPQ